MRDERGYAVLIVGGGPAGMSAAIAAAEAGLRTLLVDERPTLGGQIFKQPGPGFTVTSPRKLGRQWRFGRALIDRALASSVELRTGAAVVDLERTPDGWAAVLVTGDVASSVTVPRVILAPGAHDRPVVFPGWTLPGVITAGGLQTLAKTQRLLPGRRMVFAGAGPVALAFPAQLAGYGAEIAAALEAGPAPRASDFGDLLGAARGNADLLRDAAAYRATLIRHRVPLRYGRIVVRVEGNRRVERVVHAAVDEDWRVLPGTEESIEADLLCVGYGFAASPELFRLAGCAIDDDDQLGGPVVRKDAWGRTDIEGIYAAGDGTGVEGSFVAIDEGAIAGLAAAVDAGGLPAARAEELAKRPRDRLVRRRRLAGATSRMFRVGSGIYQLATPATVVCRCEEVTAEQITDAIAAATVVDVPADISVVKAFTRAGMGPCQGRYCQRHIASLIADSAGTTVADIPVATPRMPVRPVPIAVLADHSVPDPGLFVAQEAAP